MRSTARPLPGRPRRGPTAQALPSHARAARPDVAQAQRRARAKMAAGSASRWLGAAAAAAAVRSRGPRNGRLPLVWIVRGLGAAPGPAARRLLQPSTGSQHAGERGGDAGPRVPGLRAAGRLTAPLLCSALPQGRSAFPPLPSTAARPAPRRTTTRCWGCRAPPARRRSRRRTTRHGPAGGAALGRDPFQPQRFRDAER